tara:strand:- start:21518 stop:21796 length:279 start_codon:yes stop_codon:yes gene_type:complete
MSSADLKKAGRCISGTSITTNPVGDGSGALLMDGTSFVADAAFHAEVSATTSVHGVEITEVQDTASYLRINLSSITPNLPPSSTILKEDGRC